MTAENPEDPICPDCGKPARCVLILGTIGTGTTIEHGDACFQPRSGSGSAGWKAYIH